MPFVPEITTVNQKVQVGAESTSSLGVSVPATKLLECFDFVPQINGDVIFYRPTGHKYNQSQEENTEWTDITLGGNLDYNGVLYPLGGVMGSVAPVTHGVSTVAKDWVFTPPVLGSIVPQTYTMEMGDSIRARKWTYGLFTDFGYKGTRKDFTVSGKMIAQPLADGITMTSSPTAVAIAPVVAKNVNVYLDPTSAALGTTQLTRVLSVDFNMTGVYGPLWVLNRATVGWTAHVDLVPQPVFKIKVEADQNGMAMLTYLQTGTTYWIRVNAQGAVIDNLQTVSLGSPASGTFTLTYKGQTTAGIAFNAVGATVQTALTGLSTVGVGNATVTGSAGGPYSVNFIGTLAQDTTAMTGSGAGLTGGTFLISQNQSFNVFQHDMAVKFNKPSAFQDDQGVYAIEWDSMVVEDPTWGKSQVFTVTNLLTAL